MNLFKYHSQPESLLWNDRFISGREARELILSGESVDKTVMGNLDLRNTNITRLPDDIVVNGHLYISHTDIQSLPDGLSVSGNLALGFTDIQELPDDLYVGNNLYLNTTPNLDKDNLPSTMQIGGRIVF